MENKFEIGDIVFEKINIERKGIVIAQLKMYGGAIKNVIVWNDGLQSDHYSFELLTEEEQDFEKLK